MRRPGSASPYADQNLPAARKRVGHTVSHIYCDGADSVDSGGRIQNDQITVVLPNTGGIGTGLYTLGGITLIMATALICALGRLFKNKPVSTR